MRFRDLKGQFGSCAASPSRGGWRSSPDDKLRLVLLYRNYKGPLASEDRTAIGIDRSGLNNADLQAVSNMDLLGANKDAVQAPPESPSRRAVCTTGSS